MNLSRSVVKNFQAYLSTQPRFSRKKSHYDTLNVPEQSTQEDIKSAYYKLSKEFHPDVNKSETAKKRFQDISDAYEVLGNFSKRRLYDRDLVARGGDKPRQATYSNVVPEDTVAAMYRRQTTGHPFSDNESQKFDFDAWTRAHYGRTLNKSLREKNNRILREQMLRQQKMDKESNADTIRIIAVTTSFILFMLMMEKTFITNYDEDSSSNKKK